MELTEFKLEYSTVKKEGSIPVIIVAAGSSTRMQGISKQFVSLCGVPAIVHTLMAFERCKIISDIILVTKSEFIGEMSSLSLKYGISKLKSIVPGGTTRQESVANGLREIENEKYALIHDGARPLVSEMLINSVASQLNNYDCVIPAISVKDSIKCLNDDKTVKNSVDRSSLAFVQTPQGVNIAKYLEILKNTDVSAFTDDASVFESAGIAVKTVEGDAKNIKITTRDDILLAKYYLESEVNEE